MQEINSLQKFVKDNGELQQFKTGQLISDRDKEPNDLHLIIEGEARLIFKNFNKRSTLIKIGPGDFIGLESLIKEITSYVNNLTSQIDNSTISNSRHYDLLNKTYEEIHKVKISISKGISSDLLAIDIKQAIYFLGELTGEISNDEVLGNIFSKFCIGK